MPPPLRCQLECEPRLADAADAHQRDEPRRAEQSTQLRDLAFPPDEARQLGRQLVIGPDLAHPYRDPRNLRERRSSTHTVRCLQLADAAG
jgi:hypothetical protein